jgi:hypothetical protein
MDLTEIPPHFAGLPVFTSDWLCDGWLPLGRLRQTHVPVSLSQTVNSARFAPARTQAQLNVWHSNFFADICSRFLLLI